MESRNTMILGGATVAIVTFAVASAVSLTNEAALSNSPGRALAASSITLPQGTQTAAPANTGDASTSPIAPAPSPVKGPTTAVIVPAPAPVTVTSAARSSSVSTATAEPAAAKTKVKASTAGKASTAKAKTSATHADKSGKVKSHTAKSNKAKSRLAVHGPANTGTGTNRMQAQRATKTPASWAGPVSGGTESPSSTHGSKKGQSPHSPDACD